MLPNSTYTESERIKAVPGQCGDLTKRPHCVKIVTVAGAIEAHLDHSRATQQNNIHEPDASQGYAFVRPEAGVFCTQETKKELLMKRRRIYTLLAIAALPLTLLLTLLTASPLASTAVPRPEWQPLESLTALNSTEATESDAPLSVFSVPSAASVVQSPAATTHVPAALRSTPVMFIRTRQGLLCQGCFCRRRDPNLPGSYHPGSLLTVPQQRPLAAVEAQVRIENVRMTNVRYLFRRFVDDGADS